MNIKVDINAFLRGELTLKELTERLTTLVRADPSITQDVITQLDESYRAKLVPLDVFMGLVEHVRSSTTSQQWTAATAADSASDPSLLSRLHTYTHPTQADPTADATTLNTDGPMAAGTEIKGRFVVERVLGIGGMGTVYKVRDKVRDEAKDRYPHVALKVLNADFKQHAKAFIALQRECSRTQRLAHPNIATVYDFDRSEGMVFMTMELLEGTPLDMFIKRVMPKGGLPFDQAFPLIEGMGKALAYAHQHGIVHADFKPGNAFITQSGAVKVLDFGIARATKEPGEGGQTTLFDGADLGALTPAYASPEMHDGLEPDPRDDIFALACVAYELLSGRHPFDKQAANTARARKLVVEPVPGLSRLRMQGLARGLSFEREQRSADVDSFLKDLSAGGQGAGAWKWLAWGGLAAALLLAAGGAYYLLATAEAPETELPDAAAPGPVESPAASGATPDTVRVALEDRLRSGLQAVTGLGDFDPLREDYRLLARHASDSPLIEATRLQLGALLKKQVETQSAEQQFDHAYAALARYQEFVTPSLQAELRGLVQTRERALAERQAREERSRQDEEARRRAAEQVAAARQAAEQQMALEQERQRLETERAALAEEKRRMQERQEADRLAAEKAAAEKAAAERAAAERAAAEKAAAEKAAAEKAAAEKAAAEKAAAEKAAAEKAAAERVAQQEQEKQRRARQAAAQQNAATATGDRTEQLKQAFLTHARALRSTEAESVLKELRAELPASDPFLLRTAPEALAGAYLDKARQQFGIGRTDQAVRDLETGLVHAPRSNELLDALTHYSAVQTMEWELNSLRERESFGNFQPLQKAMAVLKARDETRYRDGAERLYALLEQRVRALQESKPDAARDWLHAGQQVLPDYRPMQDLKVLEPVQIAIVVHAKPDPGSPLTLEQYSHRMGEALAKQLGIIMKDGKLLARLITDTRTSRALHNESSAHEANKSVCQTQGVNQVLSARFLPQSSSYGSEPIFDQADFELEVYDCRNNSKANKKFSVNSHRNDAFDYELGVREALVQFAGQYSFVKSY